MKTKSICRYQCTYALSHTRPYMLSAETFEHETWATQHCSGVTIEADWLQPTSTSACVPLAARTDYARIEKQPSSF